MSARTDAIGRHYTLCNAAVAYTGLIAKFYYSRTKRVVEIPDHLADAYEGRARYTRLDDPVPDGTVSEVLEWADSPERRRAALDAERRGKRRKGILDTLS